MTQKEPFSEHGNQTPSEGQAQGPPKSPVFVPPVLPPTLPLEEMNSGAVSTPPEIPLEEKSVPEIRKSRQKQGFVVPELNHFFQNQPGLPPAIGQVQVVPPIRKKEEKSVKKWHWRNVFRSQFSISSIVSLIFHFLLLFILMFLVIRINDGMRGAAIISGMVQDAISLNQLEQNISTDVTTPEVISTETVMPSEQFQTKSNVTAKNQPAISEIIAENQFQQEIGDIKSSLRPSSGGGFASRTVANRNRSLNNGDVSAAGENAVEAGLQWLVVHQFPDGGWDFRLKNDDYRVLMGKPQPCPGLCTNPGRHQSRNAATGLAILAFLGAGYTHLNDSPYRENIQKGLDFLRYNASVTPEGRIDFRKQTSDQGMYTQGIVTTAFCEAYGMTGDRSLLEPAQRGLDFITWAQNPQLGGWRYTPYPEGLDVGGGSDTTVTGWQFMALKSGQMAGLNVSQSSMQSVSYFLDKVSTPGTDMGEYSYMVDHAERWDESHRATTSIGLLLRMYLGWRPEFSQLAGGIEKIRYWGPSFLWIQKNSPTNPEYRGAKAALYYEYYATLALHHHGGPGWGEYYPQIYNYLITHQAQSGHETGSWFFPDRYCDEGGRLLNTCLAIMILEVPYRFMPLYQNGK